MNIQSLTRRVRHPRHSVPVMSANAAPLPAPTFTPAAALRATGPIHIPYGRHLAPSHQRPVPAGTEAVTTLRRVLGGLQNLPAADAPRTGNVRRKFEAELRREFGDLLAPAPAPAPVPSRAEQFTADMRHKGGLPIFRSVAHDLGWSGLNEDWRAPAPVMSGFTSWGDWEHDSLHVIAAQSKTARIEIDCAVSDLRRHEERLRTAADVAHVLAEPAGGAA